ncbi:MAG: hypothetical protein AAF628_20805 [Planctomycetota bacterium]
MDFVCLAAQRRAALFAVALAPITAPAQHVLVVDAQGRPGTHFTGLAAAMRAAAPGDFLRLRDGDDAVTE